MHARRTGGSVGGSRTLRIVLLIVMDLLVVVAVLLTARVIVEFFGSLAGQSWARALIALTNPLVALMPLGEPVKTPYGGIFDVAAAILVVVTLGVEWLLSVVRSRV